ncbi:MAG: DNA-binding Lrp family transcriptional regulator [Marinobacter maritimus]|jgi:DNA-binding Lrp family transcriptional regulator|uniref:siroheme decarboxylase subunit beta n=1 Tax=Marinobacter maritimus TaxID=277961 RepID=UPI00119EBAF6|nr:Lrp/AsnC family transcriptional regulator [Marinobacter maritimus]
MSQPFPADYLAPDSASPASSEVSAWGLLRLRQQLEQGLPLAPRPYLALAERTGLTEQEVISAITQWQEQGLIKRFGLVVKHRTLGYTANAMVVWNIPDEQVQALGKSMAGVPFITLCYQRPRRLPDWPYNLFCMIHGTNRERVLAQLEGLIADHNLQHIRHSVLFSNKAYRQRGGRYVSHD